MILSRVRHLIFLLCASSPVISRCYADSLPINNPSFEAQPLSPGAWIDGTLTGWTLDEFFAGPQRFTTDQYPGGVPDGPNAAFSRGPTISQTLTATLQPETRYTLSVDVGHRLDGAFPSYDVQLRAGSDVLTEDNNSHPPSPGQWLNSTRSFQTGTHPVDAGQNLQIRIATPGVTDPTGFTQANYDNVRLTATHVPTTHVLSVGVNWPNPGGLAQTGYRGGDAAQSLGNAYLTVDPHSDVSNLSLFASAPGHNTQRLMNAFQVELNSVQPGDSLIMYVTSHGDKDQNGSPYIALQDSAFTDANSVDRLTVGVLRGMLSDPKLNDVNKVILLDSCDSGNFLSTLTPGIPNIAAIASSLPDQNAQFADPGFQADGITFATGSPYFGDGVVDALQMENGFARADTDRNGHVSMLELETFLEGLTTLNGSFSQFVGQDLLLLGLPGSSGTFDGIHAQTAVSPDFTGDFAIVPEPSTVRLLIIGIFFIALRLFPNCRRPDIAAV